MTAISYVVNAPESVRQSIEIFRSRLKSDNIFPAPSTTDDSGS